MRLWAVMYENFLNCWGTLTVYDWTILVGITIGWLVFQYKRKW